MTQVNNLRCRLVSRVTRQNLLAQVRAVYMRIDFCSREIFMS